MSPNRAFTVRVEEIMTPRSVLVMRPVGDATGAAEVARENGFEAVPLVGSNGFRTFWSRSADRIKPITRRHRVQHDDTVEWVLQRLAEHQVQFVFYRDELVGLVDLSDLNKPLGRLVVFRPLLDLEQAIFLAVRARRIPDEDVAKVLGASGARKAQGLKRRAAREDLDVPLLEFVGFPDVLRIGSTLGVVAVTASDVERLGRMRNRAAHGVLDLIKKRDDGRELMWTLRRCREILVALHKP